MRKRRQARPKGRRNGLRRILGWVAKAIAAFIILSILWVLLYRFVPPPITFTQIGDHLDGRHVTKEWMSIDRIDRDMVRAAIAAEDSKFCSHYGFDQDAIAEAMRRNDKGGSVIRGGSTISQQTAKNAFLWQGGGYARKAVEAWFTLLIETLWGKRRIMEVYLNVAETGIGTYGVNAGSQRYFNHDAASISRTEAARIAAVLPLPKKRGAVTPRGFTRRYGNSIAARVGVVARQGLDACVYSGKRTPKEPIEAPKSKAVRPTRKPAPPTEPIAPPPATLPGEEYENPLATPAAEPPASPPVTTAPEPCQDPTE